MKLSENVNTNNYNRINEQYYTTKYDKNTIANPESDIVQEKIETEEKQNFDQEQDSEKQLLDAKQAADLAITYNMRTDKSLIGSSSNLTDLDITKEISSMKKDSVLQEYSYFINDIDPEDGFIIRKTK